MCSTGNAVYRFGNQGSNPCLSAILYLKSPKTVHFGTAWGFFHAQIPYISLNRYHWLRFVRRTATWAEARRKWNRKRRKTTNGNNLSDGGGRKLLSPQPDIRQTQERQPQDGRLRRGFEGVQASAAAPTGHNSRGRCRSCEKRPPVGRTRQKRHAQRCIGKILGVF